MTTQPSSQSRRPVPDWSQIATGDGLVAGVDEVGRGAWAGPVVAAAVILPHGLMLAHLGDSKLVSARRRIELDRHIRRLALAVGIGWVAAAEIDAVGLSQAVRLSGERALSALELYPDRIILDGSHNYLSDTRSQAIVKADAYVVPVAAASVVAKVARDRYMHQLGLRYPIYGFGSHVGYGAVAHRTALARHGSCPAHRLSFKPLKALAS